MELIFMKKWVVFVVIILCGLGFSAFISAWEIEQPVPILASPQRIGNAKQGWQYLITGDYVKSGIPYNLYVLGSGASKANYLKREGFNKKLSYEYTAVTAKNGQVLAAPNCLQCHAQVFNNELIIGLGNTSIDFSNNKKVNAKKIQHVESILKTLFPNKYEAAAPFFTVTQTIAPYLYTKVRGVNAAGRLAYVLIAHRDPNTFQWTNRPILEIPDEVIPTDTPPWWLLKKKNAMFYNGFGRGDFGRFLMASNLLTVNDTSESRQVDEHMPDLLAYIYSITPPKYTYPVNEALLLQGKVLFEKSCSKCHGSYGEKESYPNLLIPEAIIKTDSLLFKSNYSNPQFVNWFNKSWFTQGDHPARLEPFEGYIAPPLDGIWITAPYLHNGSVPTLESLLNSKLRPRYWSRNFENPEYDYEKIGWKFSIHNNGDGTTVYNTDWPGYGNYGHYFGDKLTDEERKAVIEYLKTL
jgi:mono/diheme cytochrome c family protein